jgi:ABC-type sugar transport system permease subunit
MAKAAAINKEAAIGKKKTKHRGFTIEKRRAWQGRMFILPWFIGLVFFFIKPLIQSFMFCFQKIFMDANGYTANFVGLENFRYILLEDSIYIRTLAEVLLNTIMEVPLILVFSIFIALILNQKFRGRLFARTIFFLPVIIATGLVIELMKEGSFTGNIGTGETVYLYNSVGIEEILVQSGISETIVGYFTEVINHIFDLTWKSGIQIVMFLSALQTVPRQLYEAASVEGATSWEAFWKITFPMISPMIVVNVVYTIIDSFTYYGNEIVKLISESSAAMKYDYSSVASWIYFVCIGVILAIVMKLISKHIFYAVE